MIFAFIRKLPLSFGQEVSSRSPLLKAGEMVTHSFNKRQHV